jgi:hypothetical protein
VLSVSGELWGSPDCNRIDVRPPPDVVKVAVGAEGMEHAADDPGDSVAAKVTGPFTVAKPWKANGVATSALAEHADVAAGAVGVGESCTAIHGTPVGATEGLSAAGVAAQVKTTELRIAVAVEISRAWFGPRMQASNS